MAYRSNLYYSPIETNSFEEQNTINYGTISSQMAPKHYNSSTIPFSHSTSSMKNNNFDDASMSHNYETFLSQRNIIITSQCQDSEGSSKRKRYRSKSRSPHKSSYDKRKRNKRLRSHERESRSVEIKKDGQNYKGDYYSFSNKHRSDSVSSYNNNVVHKQDDINYDSTSKLLLGIDENQDLDNSSRKNRYLPKSNITISQNLGQFQDSPTSSLESSPLDNQPDYYLNYPSTRKNLVIENPFSGALYLQNIQNISEISQFHSDTSSAKGIRANYEKQDKHMQRSSNNHEEFFQNLHSMPYTQKSPSVVLVSSGSEDNLDSACNFYNNPNEQIFANNNEKSFSGSLISSGQGNIKNEQLPSFSSQGKCIPMENVTLPYQSMIGIGNTSIEKEQVRVDYINESFHGTRENVQTISDDNKDFVIPDFNSDTSKLTPEQWINLIEELSIKRDWNDDDKRYMMTSRLRGLASKWYLSKGINYKKWNSLKNMFIRAFPTQIEYYPLLKRMMARKKEDDESIANYFHHKVALLNACEIFGQRAVSCLIYGIPDDKIIHEARLQNFNNIDSLYAFLRTCHFSSESKDDEEDNYTISKVEKHVTTQISQSKDVKTESSKTKSLKTKVIKTSGVKVKAFKVSKSFYGNRCFRCGSPNHWKSSCKNSPKLCCSRCGRSDIMTKHCDC